MSDTTRFAPSPTGYLHLGHAYSALFSRHAAKAGGGRFLLRIEDIDPGRCRPEFENAILEDLNWLGLNWDAPLRRQSGHMPDYNGVILRLGEMGLLYPCFCSRRDIAREIEAAAHAPHGPDGPVYPGTCKTLSRSEREDLIGGGKPFAQRLDMKAAMHMSGNLTWKDRKLGAIKATPEVFGDVVLARKETPTSYHVSVTHDDHLQDVTLVTRGMDLFDATHVHRLLQHLMGWSAPDYCHHRLITDKSGKRYAKRDKSPTLRHLREIGKSRDDVLDMIGWRG